jgi:hypothetical protein
MSGRLRRLAVRLGAALTLMSPGMPRANARDIVAVGTPVVVEQ